MKKKNKKTNKKGVYYAQKTVGVLGLGFGIMCFWGGLKTTEAVFEQAFLISFGILAISLSAALLFGKD